LSAEDKEDQRAGATGYDYVAYCGLSRSEKRYLPPVLWCFVLGRITPPSFFGFGFLCFFPTRG